MMDGLFTNVIYYSGGIRSAFKVLVLYTAYLEANE
jgi:hypothetical protein